MPGAYGHTSVAYILKEPQTQERGGFFQKIVWTAILLFSLSGASYAVTDMPFPNLSKTALVQPIEDEFIFAVIGDYRPARRDIPYPEAFNRMLEEIGTIRPSLVISAGDAYFGYGGSFQRFKNEIARFLSKIDTIGVPFYNAIGNHEVTDELERMQYVNTRYGRLYGSFDVGSTHFIALNTEEKGLEGRISGEQFAWLRKDLDANKNARYIFVFMHRPLFSAENPDLRGGISSRDKDNHDVLHGLFKKYKVQVVFAGHEHLFDDTTKDGVRYLIVGGGGAPLSKSAGQGGFYQYLIVSVNKKNVLIDVISPKALEMRRIFGNDGFEHKAELEVVNVSHAKLTVGSLPFIMPAAASEDRYRASAYSLDGFGEKTSHAVRIAKVRDNGDGTASVSVGTVIPGEGYIRVIVEADLDK